MNLHEHQAKQLLSQQGLPIPRGHVAFTPEEVAAAFRQLEVPACAIKSQIHAGGRGKGKIYAKAGDAQPVVNAGVSLVRSDAEAKALAQKMFGNTLVTKQTGPAGRAVRRIYVEAASKFSRELYASITLDRNVGLPALALCREGGTDIEEVAARNPERIQKMHYAPSEGLWPHQARFASYFLGLEGEAFKDGVKLFSSLAAAFSRLDCALLEINPLVVTAENRLAVLDAKISLDDNALFRHRELAELADPNEENPLELEAKAHDLSYISLDGDIGCMVNGAGLAMATMDVIQLYGRQPANFLDVGGGATQEKVTAAFKIILKDPKVKAVLVNIFGGIMKCDVIAKGVLAAVREIQPQVPLVVRLEGTNVQQGRELLEHSGLSLRSAGSLREAAEIVTQQVRQTRSR